MAQVEKQNLIYMRKAKGRGRAAVALGIVLACTLLAWSPGALALDPALDVSQYAHTSWKVRDGFFKDSIGSIAQTPDGYLWLGTQFGLLRFDGVRYVLWQPPAGQQLPSNYIRSLFAARDGRLWIATQLGLASWKDGKLTLHTELPGQVGRIMEDREGTIWAGTRYPPPGRLCAFRGGSVQCYGEDGRFGYRASSLYEDRAGNLWVGAETGLWRWQPGPPKLYPLADFESSQGLVEGDNGALLIAERRALKQLVGEKVVEYRLPVNGLRFQPSRLLRDRDGSLWIGTFDRGLVHLHQGRVDLFSQADGLSGNYIRDLFEDREGNIWVATDNGLDRFRHVAVSTISVSQGLSQATPWSVLAARDGSIWVGTLDGLNRLKDGQITTYYKRNGSARQSPTGMTGNEPSALGARRKITDRGLPDDLIHSLFEDDQRRIWASTRAGVAYFENEQFIPVSGIPGGVHTIVGDAAGNIWISDEQNLFHWRGGRVIEQFPWASLGRKTAAFRMLADPVRGGLWLGFRDGTGLAYFQDANIRATYTAAEGLGQGLVGNLQMDTDGALWVATEGGLSRVKDGRVATLTAKNGLPCDGVLWVIEDDDHAFWLYTACGLARVARSEVEAWAAAVEKDKNTGQRVQATVFDISDGVRIHAAPGGYTPQVGKSPDGRLWFLPWDGVSVIDPRRLLFNPLLPPVHIEQITADRKTYDAARGLRLPPLARDLQIDFTALSFVAPEKIRFRYKLEGYDNEWQEAGSRRQAFYTNLPPRPYRFRVMACNNSGVWNEEGAVLDFSIAPAFYQRTSFRLACVAALLASLIAAYRLRVRQIAHQFNKTLEARVSERTRIARELHDTLLQSFQGLLLRFQSASNILPARPVEAKQRLDSALDQAAEAITEGRDAVQGLRSSASETNDLANGITAIAEELTNDASALDSPAIDVEVEGPPRDLNPVVRDEAYRIAVEALRNAFRHAQARRIAVEIRYDKRQFRLRVRDDGKGLDEKTIRRQPAGHFGLHGMGERAENVGGRLEVRSRVDSGTEVELIIPARIAYGGTARRSWLSKGL